MPADRHNCPDCGASHPRRQPKRPRKTLTANTDLHPAKCPHCAAPTLAGRIEGLDLHLDPAPLNHLGALTFTGHPDRTLITRKDSRGRLHTHTTRWPPPDGTAWHTTHHCDKPIGPLLRDVPIDRCAANRPQPTPTPNRPPY